MSTGPPSRLSTTSMFPPMGPCWLCTPPRRQRTPVTEAQRSTAALSAMLVFFGTRLPTLRRAPCSRCGDAVLPPAHPRPHTLHTASPSGTSANNIAKWRVAQSSWFEWSRTGSQSALQCETFLKETAACGAGETEPRRALPPAPRGGGTVLAPPRPGLLRSLRSHVRARAAFVARSWLAPSAGGLHSQGPARS